MNECSDKREFFRVDYEAPVMLKVDIAGIFKELTGFSTLNISPGGVLLRLTSDTVVPPSVGKTVWISLDRQMRGVLENRYVGIEHDLMIHERGIYGRVVHVTEVEFASVYNVGIAFMRRTGLNECRIKDLLGRKGLGCEEEGSDDGA